MGVENFRVFYLLYVNDDVSALKRISIDIQRSEEHTSELSHSQQTRMPSSA